MWTDRPNYLLALFPVQRPRQGQSQDPFPPYDARIDLDPYTFSTQYASQRFEERTTYRAFYAGTEGDGFLVPVGVLATVLLVPRFVFLWWRFVYGAIKSV